MQRRGSIAPAVRSLTGAALAAVLSLPGLTWSQEYAPFLETGERGNIILESNPGGGISSAIVIADDGARGLGFFITRLSLLEFLPENLTEKNVLLSLFLRYGDDDEPAELIVEDERWPIRGSMSITLHDPEDHSRTLGYIIYDAEFGYLSYLSLIKEERSILGFKGIKLILNGSGNAVALAARTNRELLPPYELGKDGLVAGGKAIAPGTALGLLLRAKRHRCLDPDSRFVRAENLEVIKREQNLERKKELLNVELIAHKNFINEFIPLLKQGNDLIGFHPSRDEIEQLTPSEGVSCIITKVPLE